MTTITETICNLKNQAQTSLEKANQDIVTLLKKSGLSDEIIGSYSTWLDNQSDLRFALETFFKNPSTQKNVPLFIYNENQDNIVTIFANKHSQPTEPGEQGSILAYVRANGLTDAYLCSDCFGQLSCSSCAVEILAGTPKNPTPREEEYDMLDIDEQKPPTEKTRLGCQTVVGDEALVIMIRKSLS